MALAVRPLYYQVATWLLQGNFSLSLQGSNPGLDCKTLLFGQLHTLGSSDATGHVVTSSRVLQVGKGLSYYGLIPFQTEPPEARSPHGGPGGQPPA